MGKVGTGCPHTVSGRIRKQLDAVVSPKSKLIKLIKATWGRAEVRRRDRIPRITANGLLRQAPSETITERLCSEFDLKS